MTSTYRGIKYNQADLPKDKAKKTGGIYRGVKHEAVDVEMSPKAKSGIYRGQKWVA